MIYFEDISLKDEKSTEENIRLIKSYLTNLVDSLNMLAQEVESIKKEREGK